MKKRVWASREINDSFLHPSKKKMKKKTIPSSRLEAPDSMSEAMKWFSFALHFRRRKNKKELICCLWGFETKFTQFSSLRFVMLFSRIHYF